MTENKPGTMLGRFLKNIAPEGSLFHEAVNVVDETAEELIFDNGEKLPTSSLMEQVPGYDALKDGLIGHLKEAVDLPFLDGEAESDIENGFGLIAKGLLKQFGPSMLKNIL